MLQKIQEKYVGILEHVRLGNLRIEHFEKEMNMCVPSFLNFRHFKFWDFWNLAT